ncbi:transglycosylase SLT domain-containing protein [Methylonatrum kenyense]|uniref:transglycosylase SLT domain-containing protein n=1 Tax=Methylonatrum kenyense TaxID=455253 RepID=UPI0020C0CA37|nr:transglycosylase SLT domain-containing protein [Methylonatrum kenyense]MCK8516557.1 transglycosylase SLT domain-containing protein [Methylonatrum kenyense]
MRLVLFALMLLLLQPAMAGTALAAEPHAERSLFIATWDRLGRGNRDVDLDQVLQRLGDYPLAPYLEWRALRQGLPDASGEDVRRFVERHPNLAVTPLLQRQWLNHLGQERRWAGFLAHWDGQGGTTMDCYRLRALRMEQGVDQDWVEEAVALWTVGHSQPDACDAVFDVLYDRELLSREQRWERIRLIMARDDRQLARALRPRIDRRDRDWLDDWLRLAGNPERRLRDPHFDTKSDRGRELIADGIRRLAIRERDVARELLDRFRERQVLDRETGLDLQRQIALRAAWSRDGEAAELLAGLPAEAVNNDVYEWSARIAVGQQQWERVLRLTSMMPGELAGTGEWRYWRGEALARNGRREEAEGLLEELARERSYYGFLAADRLELPYAMNDATAAPDQERQQALSERIEFLRARELRAVNLETEARREWLAGIDRMNSAEDLFQAAAMAIDWNWYDRAVFTANRAGLNDAVRLRFPIAWRQDFQRSAEAEGLDLALIYAISRKESAFIADARSHAGALGLMQVMPGTARQTAAGLGLPSPSDRDLREPTANLRLGANYLAEMLDRFDGNLIMASAAYNAGPNRVDGWVRDNAGQPAAVWIENITFGETRDYVKSILAFRAVYDWQLNGEPRRLRDVMPERMPGPRRSEG